MRVGLPICLLVIGATIAGMQAPASSPGDVILVRGVGLQETRLTRDDLARMTRATVKTRSHDDDEATFEGVRAGDILKRAGFTFGQHMRGPRMADYLLVRSADGYRAVFALPELDAAFSDRVVILADRCDGKLLSVHDGPFRIVVSDEKRHARWVRNVASLSIATATP